METELISKLFKKEVLTFDNILLVMSLLVGAVSIVLLLMIYTQGVELKATPESIEVLRSALREALSSGV